MKVTYSVQCFLSANYASVCPCVKWDQIEVNSEEPLWCSPTYIFIFFGLLLLYRTRSWCLLGFFCGWLRLVFCCIVFQEIRSPKKELAEQEPKFEELLEDCIKYESTSESKQRFSDKNGLELCLIFVFYFFKGKRMQWYTAWFQHLVIPQSLPWKSLQVPIVLTNSPMPRRLKSVSAVPAVSRCLLCKTRCFWPVRGLLRWAFLSVLGPGTPLLGFVLREGLRFSFYQLWIFQ